MNSPRVLITGGAGFIGSALAWALNRRGCDEIVIADFLDTSEKWRNLVPLRFEDYLEADVLRSGLTSNPDAFGRFTHVFHLGACSATTEPDARYLIENNYRYTVDLATWALATNTRFIYASSAATYGDGTRGMRDGFENLEDLRPLNMYGYSKHLFDLYARRMAWTESVVGLKYFNIFGPNEDHKGEMRSLVHKAYATVRKEGRIRLFRSEHPEYHDGCQMRDFCYVKDAVAMTLHLGFNYTGGGLFNVGTGRARTWIDLARALFNACGVPEQIEYIDLPEKLRDKYQYFTEADCSRLRATGYGSSPTSLEDAIDDYVCNYLDTCARLGDENNAFS